MRSSNPARLIAAAAALVAVLELVFLLLPVRPPSERSITASFNAHRATFERIRDMLATDDSLVRVADWGIEKAEGGFEKPPDGKFSVLRYREYLALLKEVGARAASRRRGTPADPCVLIWVSGFAGDTRHRSVCWLSTKPEHEVSSLAQFERSAKPRTPVFKHIDSGWYIWADW